MRLRFRLATLAKAAAFVLFGAVGGPSWAQETGTISGTVTASSEGGPLANAQVVIPGTGIGALTNTDGRFLLLNVPSGEQTVQVQLIGYGTLERTVTVQAGGTVSADFALRRSALQLDQIVVTGAGQATERRQLGNTIATINAGELETAPINTVTDVLQSRTPGVLIAQAGGTPGQASQIRIRGHASLSQSNTPIIYLNGVRIDAGPGEGANPSSRLDDINPESIERIEILKGAAAATLYGTEASSGVIQIFTKTGQPGDARWTFRTGGGFSRVMESRYLPIAGFAMDEDPSPRPYGTDLGTRGIREYWGIEVEPFEVFSVPLTDLLFETGRHHEQSLEVSGGTELLTYYAGGRYSWEDGVHGATQFGPPEGGPVYNKDIHELYQANANVSVFPTENLRVQLTSRYTHRRYTPMNSGTEGIVPLTSYGKPEIATFLNPAGWTSFMSIRDAMQVIDRENTDRYGGSISASYAVTPEINVDFLSGLDMVNQTHVRFHPFGWAVSGTTGFHPDGERVVETRNVRNLSFEGRVQWGAGLGEDLTSSLVVGSQALLSDTHVIGSEGARFPGPGLEITEAASIQSATEQALSTVNLGVFAQEQVGFRDYLFVTLGLRMDQHSAFGADAGAAFYPKASVSFVASDMPGWREFGPVSSLRLRGAVGQSGLQPGAFDAITTWSPQPSELGPGLLPDNLGNPELRPEVTTEWEGGFELGLYDDRFGVRATYWNRIVNDALVPRQFAPSGGFISAQLDNIGRLDAQGVDILVNGTIYQSADLSIDVFANGAYIQETVTSLGGAPAIKLGGVRQRAWIREGYSPGALFGGRISDAEYPFDLERNGELSSREDLLAWFSQPRSPEEVHDILLGLPGPEENGGGLLDNYLGKPTPNWSGSFGADIRFLRNFSFSNVFAYEAGDVTRLAHGWGFRTSNATLGRNTPIDAQIESTLLNPASTAEERLEAARRFSRRGAALDTFNGINQAQDASFLRWREASLSYRFPSDLAGRLGAEGLTLTAAARNIALWTPFKGTDPERSRIVDGGVEQGHVSHHSGIPRRFTFSASVTF